MKTLVYESKVESRGSLLRRNFPAAEQIKINPHIISSSTGSLLVHAEKCIATGRGHFEQII